MGWGGKKQLFSKEEIIFMKKMVRTISNNLSPKEWSNWAVRREISYFSYNTHPQFHSYKYTWYFYLHITFFSSLFTFIFSN